MLGCIHPDISHHTPLLQHPGSEASKLIAKKGSSINSGSAGHHAVRPPVIGAGGQSAPDKVLLCCAASPRLPQSFPPSFPSALSILGLLDIMLCDHLSSEQEANLRQMKSCCASLLGLLNNLLDLAKVEAGKMQLEVLEFDIVGELESLVDMFSVQGLSNGTEIALDLSDDIDRTVKGDPSRVRQVFANLLSNACKFTKNGQVVVRGWVRDRPPPQLAKQDLSIPGEKGK
ncbi:unnamed protein product [Closterium sp. NIES-53]